MTARAPSNTSPTHRYYANMRSSVIPTPKGTKPTPKQHTASTNAATSAPSTNRHPRPPLSSAAASRTISPTRASRNYSKFQQPRELPKSSQVQSTAQAMSDRLETGLTPVALKAIVDMLNAGVPPEAVVAVVSSLSQRQGR